MQTGRATVSYAAFIAGTLLGIGAFVIYPDEPKSQRPPDLVCTLRFSLSAWSFIGKHSEGSGVVTCVGGETARVRIVARGAGLSSGNSHVDGASGKFTDVHDLAEILGTYTDDTACRQTARCPDAQVLRNGDVLLALSGSNKDVDLTMGLGEFTLTRGR